LVFSDFPQSDRAWPIAVVDPRPRRYTRRRTNRSRPVGLVGILPRPLLPFFSRWLSPVRRDACVEDMALGARSHVKTWRVVGWVGSCWTRSVGWRARCGTGVTPHQHWRRRVGRIEHHDRCL
jgi:hypothetical protein